MSLITGIEKLTANTVNTIESIGSRISHSGFKYITKDTITTPIDCTRSPKIWANAALIF